MIRYTFVTAAELKRYQAQLEKFEHIFDYQLGPHMVKVSHGNEYTSFFYRLGTPTFLLAQEKKEIIGSVAMIKKKISFKNRSLNALYIADLKIHPGYQLTGVSNQMYTQVANFIGLNPSFCRPSLMYFVAFQTPSEGDFTTVKAPQSPLHLFSLLARINFFMVPTCSLTQLPTISLQSEEPRDMMLNLSPAKTSSLIVDLAGIRDFVQNERPLKIAHITSSYTGSAFIEYLLKAAHLAQKANYQWCCFTLDTRRRVLIDLLAQHGITATSTAHIYGFIRTASLKQISFVSLDTYEL